MNLNPLFSSLMRCLFTGGQGQQQTRGDQREYHLLDELWVKCFSYTSIISIRDAVRISQVSKNFQVLYQDRLTIIDENTVAWAREIFNNYTYSQTALLNAPNNQIRYAIEINMPPMKGYGKNLLGYAISELKHDIVEQLLKSGIDPNQHDWDQNLPLHSALFSVKLNSDSDVEKLKKIIDFLVKFGFDINSSFQFAYDILSLFGTPNRRGNLGGHEIVTHFIERGLNINMQVESTGKTLLHAILELHFDVNAPWIQYLLELDCDPTITNNRGETPIDIAKQHGLNRILDVFSKFGYQV